MRTLNQNQREIYLIDYLCSERKQKISQEEYSFDLYRALVNVRAPLPISQEYLQIEDAYLQNRECVITKQEDFKDPINIWKGDITTLKVDAIVNAANDQMLGCFVPGHHCIDNAIHTYAGVRLRIECEDLMRKQGYAEPTGKAKITKAYNLPCSYVIHTVGPIVNGPLRAKDCELLKSSYLSCLQMATSQQLESIAFCCISTGVFGFPKVEAASIAIQTVREYLQEYDIKVIFNVFSEEDEQIYKQLLK